MRFINESILRITAERMLLKQIFDEIIKNLYFSINCFVTIIVMLHIFLSAQVFGGSWEEIIGTAIFFEETEPVQRKTYFSTNISKPLEFAAKTQKTLNMKRVFVTVTGNAAPKSCSPTKSEDDEQMEID